MRNTNWIFSQNAGLQFSPTPTSFTNAQMNTYEGSSSISDLSGNLILFSDGVKVWDSAGTVRATGLFGHSSSTQSALIIPDPGSPSRYYIFTADGDSGANNHLNAVRIDTASWAVAPLSAVMTTPLPPTTAFSGTERLTAIRHKNGKDFWVLTVIQRITTPANDIMPALLRVFLVSAAGVAFVGDQPLNCLVGDIGYLKARPGGKRIALAEFCTRRVYCWKFSNITGVVDLTSVITIGVPQPSIGLDRFPYGVEFSNERDLIYFSTLFPLSVSTPNYIFQYQISSSNLLIVGTYPNATAPTSSLAALQYAPDGKIYIAQENTNQLGVINSPNVAGPGCNVTFNALPLPVTAKCNLGLPNFVRDLF